MCFCFPMGVFNEVVFIGERRQNKAKEKYAKYILSLTIDVAFIRLYI